MLNQIKIIGPLHENFVALEVFGARIGASLWLIGGWWWRNGELIQFSHEIIDIFDGSLLWLWCKAAISNMTLEWQVLFGIIHGWLFSCWSNFSECLIFQIWSILGAFNTGSLQHSQLFARENNLMMFVTSSYIHLTSLYWQFISPAVMVVWWSLCFPFHRLTFCCSYIVVT